MKVADLFQIYKHTDNYRRMYEILDDGEFKYSRIRYDYLTKEILIHCDNMFTDIANMLSTSNMFDMEIREIKPQRMTIADIERELGYPIELK